MIIKKYNFKKSVQKNYINIDQTDFINLINICTNIYFPLKGFCDLDEYKKILNEKKLLKYNWTIPIILSQKNKKKLKLNKKYFLRFKKKIVGRILINSIFRIDKKNFCKKLFNTFSSNHPYVKKILNTKNSFIGGKVDMLKRFLPNDNYLITNKIKNRKRLKNAVVFSTRNVNHLGHQFLHEYLIKKGKRLVVIIIVNEKNKYDPDKIIRSYEIMKKNLKLYRNLIIGKIYLPSFYAGPNETFLQATCLKNFGFNSFLVGRDHAGYKKFFKKYDSQNIFKKLKKLKINIIKTKEPLMCSKCLKISFENSRICNCSKTFKNISINGKDIKQMLIQNNFKMLKRFTNRFVFDFLKKNRKTLEKNKGLKFYV